MNYICLILVFLLTSNLLFTQERDLIYRNSEQNESPIPQPFNVSVLNLKPDGSYEIKNQKYQSKKMMKKNILLYLEKDSGNWVKKNDTLILKDLKTNRTVKFLITSKNRLFVVINNENIIRSKWKKVQ